MSLCVYLTGKLRIMPSVCRDVGRWEPSCNVDGNANWHRNSAEVSGGNSKLGLCIYTSWPSTSTPGYISKEFSQSSYGFYMSKVTRRFSLPSTIIMYICCPNGIFNSNPFILKIFHPVYKDCLHSIFVLVGGGWRWRQFEEWRGKICWLHPIQQREVTD